MNTYKDNRFNEYDLVSQEFQTGYYRVLSATRYTTESMYMCTTTKNKVVFLTERELKFVPDIIKHKHVLV